MHKTANNNKVLDLNKKDYKHNFNMILFAIYLNKTEILQLLLMYAEAIMLAGGHIIQSNTDGLAYTISDNLVNKANEVKD